MKKRTNYSVGKYLWLKRGTVAWGTVAWGAKWEQVAKNPKKDIYFKVDKRVI